MEAQSRDGAIDTDSSQAAASPSTSLPLPAHHSPRRAASHTAPAHGPDLHVDFTDYHLNENLAARMRANKPVAATDCDDDTVKAGNAGVARHLSSGYACVESLLFLYWPYLLPWAVAFLGWLPSLVLFVLSALYSWHTGLMLGRLCKDTTLYKEEAENGEVKTRCAGSYRELAVSLYGPRFASFVGFVQIFQLFVYCVGNTIFQQTQFSLIFPEEVIGVRLNGAQWRYITFAIYLALALLVPTFHAGALMSSAGLLASGANLVLPAYALWQRGSIEPSVVAVNNTDVRSFRTLFLGVANILTGFGGHILFPELVREMRHPGHFEGVVTFICGLGLVLNMLTAFMGYAAFGASVPPAYIDALKEDSGQPLVLSMLLMILLMSTADQVLCQTPLCLNLEIALSIPTRWADAFRTQLTYSPHKGAIVPTTAAAAAESAKDDIETSATDREDGNGKWVSVNAGVTRVLLRCGVLALALFFAQMLPFFGDIASIIGAWGITQLTFIFPVMLYLRAYWREISLVERVVCCVELAAGTTVCVCGTAAAVMDTVKNVQEFHLFSPN